MTEEQQKSLNERIDFLEMAGDDPELLVMLLELRRHRADGWKQRAEAAEAKECQDPECHTDFMPVYKEMVARGTRADAAEAKLAELEKQEPIYQYMTVSMSDETWLQERWHDCTKEEFDDVNDEFGPTRRVYAQQQPVLAEGLHPETAELVMNFAEALARKLRKSEQKYGWSDGWKDSDWQEKCLADFHHHIGKGDPLDVAAYCAFMVYHGWSTRPAPPINLAELVQVAMRLKRRYICNEEGDLEFIACVTPEKSSIGTGGTWDDWRELSAILRNIDEAKTK